MITPHRVTDPATRQSRPLQLGSRYQYAPSEGRGRGKEGKRKARRQPPETAAPLHNMKHTIHNARAYAQDAIHYAAYLMTDHQCKGRESTFVSDRGLTRAEARMRMVQSLILAGITTSGTGPDRAVHAIEAWADAQGWDAWRDCEA